MLKKNSTIPINVLKIRLLMNKLDNRILIGAIVVLAAGLFGVIGMTSTTLAVGGTTINEITSGTGMVGHLTLISTDSDGNIKSYQQTDNLVTQRATNCIAQELFRDPGLATGASTTCGGDPGRFDAIAIGIGTGSTETSNTLNSETGIGGLTPQFDDTSDGVTISDDSGSGTDAVVETTFTSSGATTAITEAGIFNSTTTSGQTQMFAYQSFTAISLDSGDSLTVTWTITVDN